MDLPLTTFQIPETYMSTLTVQEKFPFIYCCSYNSSHGCRNDIAKFMKYNQSNVIHTSSFIAV